MGIVSETVRCIDELGLQQGTACGPKLLPFGLVAPLRVLHERLAHFPGEVQAGEFRVSLLQKIDPPQSVQVVIKPALIANAVVQFLLARVAERRMTQVMRQGNGLGQILVESQTTSDRARNLGHFKSMGKAGAVMVVDAPDHDLRLAHEPAECRAMDDPLAVALKNSAIWMRFLGMAPPPAVTRVHGIRSEPRVFEGEPVHESRFTAGFRLATGAALRAIGRLP